MLMQATVPRRTLPSATAQLPERLAFAADSLSMTAIELTEIIRAAALATLRQAKPGDDPAMLANALARNAAMVIDGYINPED